MNVDWISIGNDVPIRGDDAVSEEGSLHLNPMAQNSERQPWSMVHKSKPEGKLCSLLSPHE